MYLKLNVSNFIKTIDLILFVIYHTPYVEPFCSFWCNAHNNISSTVSYVNQNFYLSLDSNLSHKQLKFFVHSTKPYTSCTCGSYTSNVLTSLSSISNILNMTIYLLSKEETKDRPSIKNEQSYIIMHIKKWIQRIWLPFFLLEPKTASYCQRYILMDLIRENQFLLSYESHFHKIGFDTSADTITK